MAQRTFIAAHAFPNWADPVRPTIDRINNAATKYSARVEPRGISFRHVDSEIGFAHNRSEFDYMAASILRRIGQMSGGAA
ncbi:MAG: hypothetical protein K2Y37_14665 [Pirellulales bacterium]|nr:hypothetical protein [Pirellulales bacterium]